MDRPTDRTIFQNAWVVNDVEAACMKWVNEMGVGPFFLSEYPQGMFDEVTYRGQPADLSMKVALAQAGNVQVELIEPLSAECAYRDVIPAGSEGFHHMCVWTYDFAADKGYFDQLGYTAANTGRIREVNFAYFDTRPLMGCMLEVVSWNQSTADRFAMIAEAAQDWDGRDPIRR